MIVTVLTVQLKIDFHRPRIILNFPSSDIAEDISFTVKIFYQILPKNTTLLTPITTNHYRTLK
jgi:hypothetical protein